MVNNKVSYIFSFRHSLYMLASVFEFNTVFRVGFPFVGGKMPPFAKKFFRKRFYLLWEKAIPEIWKEYSKNRTNFGTSNR